LNPQFYQDFFTRVATEIFVSTGTKVPPPQPVVPTQKKSINSAF